MEIINAIINHLVPIILLLICSVIILITLAAPPVLPQHAFLALQDTFKITLIVNLAAQDVQVVLIITHVMVVLLVTILMYITIVLHTIIVYHAMLLSQAALHVQIIIPVQLVKMVIININIMSFNHTIIVSLVTLQFLDVKFAVDKVLVINAVLNILMYLEIVILKMEF
jgi:hypothetical protein